MMYQIDIETEVEVSERSDNDLKTAISTALAEYNILSAALTLLLTDDSHMAQLNQDFRGLNQSTDVLSFPAGDPLPGIEEIIPYLGDIAISVPIARRQAQRSGHALMAELQLLAIHGVLHLLGYDHILPEDKTRMWSVQEEILKIIGLHDIVPTEV